MRKNILIILILLSSKAFSQTPIKWLLGKEGSSTCNTRAGYLLDSFTNAAVAFSLRLLKKDYTGPFIRVRRSNDNALLDVGCLNDTLDTPALLAFVGSNSGFVVRWYDQSGNGNYLIQNGSTQQPRIVNAGVLDRVNGKPAILFIATSTTTMSFNNSTITAAGPWSAFVATKRTATSKISPGFVSAANAGIGPQVNQWSDNNFYIVGNISSTMKYRSAADATATFVLLEGYNISNVLTAYKNASAYSLSVMAQASAGTAPFSAISANASNTTSDGYICEGILYNLDKTSEQAGIRNNINLFYTIY